MADEEEAEDEKVNHKLVRERPGKRPGRVHGPHGNAPAPAPARAASVAAQVEEMFGPVLEFLLREDGKTIHNTVEYTNSGFRIKHGRIHPGSLAALNGGADGDWFLRARDGDGEYDENGAYAYRNAKDGKWWIDGPDGLGVFTARGPAQAVPGMATAWEALDENEGGFPPCSPSEKALVSVNDEDEFSHQDSCDALIDDRAFIHARAGD